MNKRWFKSAFFRISKATGLLYLSRRITRRGLRILCYHAFSNGDEVSFRPKLFMRCGTFEERLHMLKSGRYPVLSLDAALAGLESGNLPDCATVITIDDGFGGVYSCAVECLCRFGYPATIYVTSYYSVKQNPVFRLLVQYVFWKTKENQLSVPPEFGPLSGQFLLSDSQVKDRVMWEIIRHGEDYCDEPERTRLVKSIAERLRVSIDPVYQRRVMTVMSSTEIQAAAKRGIDIQLHTHRHRFPASPRVAVLELEDNRQILEPLVGRSLHHFCYPSGEWSTEHWPILQKACIRSATTCEPGLNYSYTPKLALKRFLDSDDLTPLEFEVEMSGYGDLLRRARRPLQWLFRSCAQKRQLNACLYG